MSAVKNFTFFSLHAFLSYANFFYYLLSFISIISYLLYTQISAVIQWFTTSEDVCWNIRNVKIKPFFFPEMRLYFLMFITAVCFLFLLKLRWPKNKSIWVKGFILKKKKNSLFMITLTNGIELDRNLAHGKVLLSLTF